MSARHVLFTPGKPPRAPEATVSEARGPDFILPVTVMNEMKTGSKLEWSWGLKGALALAIACVITASVMTGIAIMEVVQGAVLTRSAILAAQTASTQFDLPLTRTALQDARAGLERMERGFRRLAYLQRLPVMGDQLEAGARATSATLHTTSVLDEAFQVAEEVFASVDGFSEVLTTGTGDIRPYLDLSSEEKARFLWAISAAGGDLRAMKARLRLAQDDMRRLHSLTVHPVILEAVAPLAEILPTLMAAVEILQPLAQIVPELAGLGADQRFLIMYLDNKTLRPGGGTLPAVGQLLVRDGEVMALTVESVTLLDSLAQTAGYAVTVPLPLSQYHEQSSWLAKDAAWSPDMLETARIAAALLRQERAYLGLPALYTDDVIIITPEFLEQVLSLMGSVQVNGVTYTPEDTALITSLGASDPIFLQALLLNFTEKVFALSPSRWPEILALLHEALTAEQLLMISSDPNIQMILEESAWSGALSVPEASDVVLFVDANFSDVSEELIDKSLDYSLVPHDDGYRATVKVTYRHHGAPGGASYRNYGQLYVPMGSELILASGFVAGDSYDNPQNFAAPVTMAKDLDFLTYGGFFALEPGESQVLTFSYELAPAVLTLISQGDYELVVLKQLGSGETLLTLNLDFGTTVVAATPEEAVAEYFNTSYVTNALLTKDQHFQVRLKR